MSERASTPPIPGLLSGFVGPVVPLTVAYFASANTLERVSFRVTDPPSGGTVTVELNTESDGSGTNKIEVTIADGDDFATATGSVAIAAGGYLYQRITAQSGSAMGLSGEYEVTQSSGVTTMLTTLARVKADLDITSVDATRDALLTQLITGVSKRMQDWMDRPIVEGTATDERIDSAGSCTIQTRHYPIIAVSSLTESEDALVEDTDFEMKEYELEAGQIVRIASGSPISWPRGSRIVTATYSHGYAAVPDSLVNAATSLAVLAWNETVKSGKSWRGLLSKGVDPASSVSFDKDTWTRETVPVMAPYRRLVP